MNESSQRSEEDIFRTQFWVKRWEREKQSWDLGHIPPNLAAFPTRSSPASASVLVPGCGSGYEVRAFHEAGHDVEAIDFSGPAVAHARELLRPIGDRIIHRNFFNVSGHGAAARVGKDRMTDVSAAEAAVGNSSLRERPQSDFNNAQQFLPGRTGGRLNSQSKVDGLHILRQRVRI